MTETTALGAAYLAGLEAGVWRDMQHINSLPRKEQRFEPRMARSQVESLRERWNKALCRSRDWEAKG
jgi:glycerol kinase